MKRKISWLLAASIILLSLLSLTGCGGFFAAETKEIVDMRVEPQADGTGLLIVEFADETKLEVIIPNQGEAGKDGANGKDGNGIADITAVPENGFTKITITFTDPEMAPVTFSVPDGLSVTGIVDGEDEIGKYIVLQYSDGNASSPIYVPRGAKGNGIKTFTHTVNDDKSVNIFVELDDGTQNNILIPAPQEGNGIATIEGTEGEDGMYYLTIKDTNGKYTELSFTRPTKPEEPSRWYSSEYGIHEAIEGVKDGDFLFDTRRKVIYERENGAWQEVISFADETVSYTVTFVLSNRESFTSPEILRGNYYPEEIPVLTRENDTFLGWYTSPYPNLTTMSPFTDLTPVVDDLVLYAVWESTLNS